ncbi:spore germination protein [Paenibacillus sp. MWE-103]|uniref:Spore germination protein n=1 Tax=Paenibacillus artemisiicola TaxID=1172618 RepID=A0ABS3W4B6_9BACL|nr:spore germination protein [Paenibacillus artemisiicola]MBO7743151.1 spore germination protein [Paenibacillus artemisiicola]
MVMNTRQNRSLPDEAVGLKPEFDYNGPLSAALVENEAKLRTIFDKCGDCKFHRFQIATTCEALIVYLPGLISHEFLEQAVMRPMFALDAIAEGNRIDMASFMRYHVLHSLSIVTVASYEETVNGILSGNTAILFEGTAEAVLIETAYLHDRTITEPNSELTLRGAREGFIENIQTNLSMLRRKIKSERLKAEPVTIGDVTRTQVEIVYLSGIVNPRVLDEVKRRLAAVKLDGVLESGYIEEWLEDTPWSPFPQVQNTERPDVLAANLLEAKVGILVDGTPFALIVPFVFWGGLQAAEDYYERFVYASLIRILRLVLLLLSLMLPSIYVAITTFHPQMMPTNLLLSFASAVEPSPFPALIEALLMEFLFEVLREAGIRLPKQVGSAISIVGALVIGQAAVQAGIISAPMVIVVSLTGIASFAIPRYSFAIAFRILRFPLLIVSGMFGIIGLSIGLMFILIHLVNLESIGIPYLTPVAPVNLKNLNDVIVRVPRRFLRELPAAIAGRKMRRYRQTKE